jgi:hypothetical protein
MKAKIKSIAIILVLFSLIGIIHGSIVNSFNVFASWVLIGIWIIFSFKVIKNIKQYREFNSPHNTAFFTVGPVFIGIFYSIWGNFTGLLGENLLEGSSLYLSWWSILFGFPYVLYGSISLYRCFKKYSVIYFGTKSVKARTFGFFLSVSIILFIIIYWISFYSFVDFYGTVLVPLHFLIDLNLLIFLICTILILIFLGLSGARTRLPRLTREYVTQRTNRVNQLMTPTNHSPSRRKQTQTIRTTRRSSPKPSTRTVTHSTRSFSQSSRTMPNGYIKSRSSRVKNTSHSISSSTTGRPTKRSQTKVKQINIKLYRPKAANLSIEDFKCIFCFKLPAYPKDNGRGIILCPNCRYPAHADEFKDWLKTSGLCSRCNAPIPLKYRKNPKIISIKNYIMIYRDLLKRKY